MITEGEKITLKRFLFTQEWKVLEHLIFEMEKDINFRSKIADTEWETVKNTLLNEGEVRGIKRLMQNIIDLASQVK